METILVQAENEEQAKLVQAFIKQHKVKYHRQRRWLDGEAQRAKKVPAG